MEVRRRFECRKRCVSAGSFANAPHPTVVRFAEWEMVSVVRFLISGTALQGCWFFKI